MELTTSFSKLILSFCLLTIGVAAFACQSADGDFTNPRIQQGKVRIAGEITDEAKGVFRQPIFMTFSFIHPITGETIRKEVETDSLGRYSIEVETETNPTIGGLFTDANPYKAIYMELSQNEELRLDLHYTKNGDIRFAQSVKGALTENDMLLGVELLENILDYRSSRQRPQLYNKSPGVFLQYAQASINDRIAIVNKDTLLSDKFRKYLVDEVRLLFYLTHVFDYIGEMRLNYRNIHQADCPDSLQIAAPARGYYGFMKNLNLNLGLPMCSFLFTKFQETLLLNDTLAIPPIKESPILEWQAVAKKCLADLIGFSEGQYYDVLTANAYALQLNMEMIPLSSKQKENIHAYFKGGEIEKMLLSHNEMTQRRVSAVEPLSIYDAGNADANRLMADIIERNKGKVVIVDFWATWCAPCLMALNEVRTIELPPKATEIAHVYLTNPSSPKKLWDKKIQGIGGQHYYLDEKIWGELMNKYAFTAIPSYLIIDKRSELKHQFTGYPGNRAMAKIIYSLIAVPLKSKTVL